MVLVEGNAELEKMHRDSTIQRVQEVVSAKPVLGKPLGNFKLTFKYADDTAFEFEGAVTDVSGLFCSQKIQKDFKRVINEEIDFMNVNDVNPIHPKEETLPPLPTAPTAHDGGEPLPIVSDSKSALKDAQKAFNEYDFSEACRVLLLEEFITKQRHLILQICHLHILTDYAHNIDSSQWSLVRGLKYDYLVDGRASTFPHRKKLKDLGEVYIHVFIPTDYKENVDPTLKALDDAKVLTKIVPYIPQTVNIDQLLKAKDEIIESKEEANKLMRSELSEKSVRCDAASNAVSGFEVKNPTATSPPRRLDFIDAVLVSAPTALFCFIGWAFAPSGWVAGLIFGLPIGFVLASRRR